MPILATSDPDSSFFTFCPARIDLLAGPSIYSILVSVFYFPILIIRTQHPAFWLCLHDGRASKTTKCQFLLWRGVTDKHLDIFQHQWKKSYKLAKYLSNIGKTYQAFVKLYTCSASHQLPDTTYSPGTQILILNHYIWKKWKGPFGFSPKVSFPEVKIYNQSGQHQSLMAMHCLWTVC